MYVHDLTFLVETQVNGTFLRGFVWRSENKELTPKEYEECRKGVEKKVIEKFGHTGKISMELAGDDIHEVKGKMIDI